jgi:hypothetical protein
VILAIFWTIRRQFFVNNSPMGYVRFLKPF